MCFHNVAVAFDSSAPTMSPRYPSDYKSIWSIEDLLFCNPFTTCSAMFRNGLLAEFPLWFYEAPVGDWPLWVLLAQHGDAFFINQIMAVYRHHIGGHTSRHGPGKWLPEILHLYDIMDEALGFRYHNQVVAGKTMHLREYGKGLVAELATSLEPREAILVYLDLWEQHSSDLPPNPRELLGHAFTARFFQAAKTKNYGLIRHTFWNVARYDTAQLRDRGVWSLLFEAIFGARVSSWRKQVCRAETPKSCKSFQGIRGSR